VLAVPQKRFDTTLVSHLQRPETEALLQSPDRSTRIGRREHALLLLAVQTALRVSELAALRCQDVQLGVGAHVRCWPLCRIRHNGHVSPASTYWYLEAVPELLELISRHLEQLGEELS